jgi:hypothetical protein
MNSSINQNTNRFSCFLVVLLAASFVTACGDVDDFPGRMDTSEEKNALDRDWLDETNDLSLEDHLNHFDGDDIAVHEDIPQAVYIEDVQLPEHEAGQYDIPDNVEIRADIGGALPFANACARYEDWKGLAWNTCEKFGGELETINTSGECDGGTDSVDYSCLIESSTGELDVENFSSMSLGGEHSCKSYGNYKSYASVICGNGDIVDVKTLQPCNLDNSQDHFRSFTFTCQH